MASRRRGPSTRLQLSLRTEWNVADEAAFVVPVSVGILGALPNGVEYGQLDLRVVVNGTTVLDTATAGNSAPAPFDASMMASFAIPVSEGYRGPLNVLVSAFAPSTDPNDEEWATVSNITVVVNRPATATPTPASVSDPSSLSLAVEARPPPGPLQLPEGAEATARIFVTLKGDHLPPKQLKRVQLWFSGFDPNLGIEQSPTPGIFSSGLPHGFFDLKIPAHAEGRVEVAMAVYVGQLPVQTNFVIEVEREKDVTAVIPMIDVLPALPEVTGAAIVVTRVLRHVRGNEGAVEVQLQLSGSNLDQLGGNVNARLRLRDGNSPWANFGGGWDTFATTRTTLRIPITVSDGELAFVAQVQVSGRDELLEPETTVDWAWIDPPAPPPEPEPMVLDDDDLEDISDLTSPPEQATVILSLVALGTESEPGLPALPPNGHVLHVHLEEAGTGRALAEGILDAQVQIAEWNGHVGDWSLLEGEGSVRTFRVPGAVPIYLERGHSARLIIPAYAGADFGPQQIIGLPVGTPSTMRSYNCGSFRRSGGGVARGARVAARGLGRFVRWLAQPAESQAGPVASASGPARAARSRLSGLRAALAQTEAGRQNLEVERAQTAAAAEAYQKQQAEAAAAKKAATAAKKGGKPDEGTSTGGGSASPKTD